MTLRSINPIRKGSGRATAALGPRSFTVPSIGATKLRLNLRRWQLVALKHARRIAFTVRVSLGGRSFATTLTLLAPRGSRQGEPNQRRAGK